VKLALAAALAVLLLVAPAASAQSPAVATVEGSGEITRAQFDHWMVIAARSDGLRRVPPRGTRRHRALRDQVMQLLIQELWVRGEAARRGIVVTDAQVRRAFLRQRRRSFPRPGDFGRFLRQSGFTVGDILFRIRLEQLSNAVRRDVIGDAPPVTDEEVRAEYEGDPSWSRIPERRDVRLSRGPTRAAALAGRPRTRLYATRRGLPGAVFRRRRGVVPWRGGWLAFRVLRVHPARERALAEVAPAIRGWLEAERQQVTLDAFIDEFRERWRAATVCRPGYATEDCGRIER
jgi:hypothetical protein